MQENSRQNISLLKTVILCFNVQKLFILALALLYFTIYVTLFLYYDADFGYLSGISDIPPKIPEVIIAIFDMVPRLGFILILSYTTFSLHINYMQNHNMNFSMLKNALDNKENFSIFLKEYIISILIILALSTILVSPLFNNAFINIIIGLCIICLGSVLMVKPYVSLYYKRAVGIANLYHIMKSVLFSYICSVLVLLMIISVPVIIGQLIANMMSYHSAILLFFDFIAALMTVTSYMFLAIIIAHFSYKAISNVD